ncbi:HET-domain-containing protein [Trichoderma citrinoviride]|uniref:HET-domain-containing protein n=1 Tax=Trichoderma citrinoviride TaxID=58853 RepID=A0A2T4B8A8_9HYPO|nr:HET-domain-containing protein [Trichoderma citrinoviride]PTB65563.1 HET-domain-containing protein [Trichoderma citrinoviride]
MSLSGLESAPETRPCSSCHHPPSSNSGPTAAITNLAALFQGAESGCVSCSVLSAGIQSIVGYDASHDIQHSDSVEWLRMDMNMAASCRSLSLTLFKRQLEIAVFAPPPHKTPEFERIFPNVPVGVTDLPKTTDSDASFEWAAEKLRHCDDSHGCHMMKSDSTGPLPRRILDIGSTDNDHIRLREFDVNDGENPKYACLTHCWGTSRPSSTIIANLELHKQGIPWSVLPRLFQDTITVARRLGISLLWIDSLCIVQDNKDDWRREAAKMSSVYQNAYIVISASKASGSEESLFGGIDYKLKPSIIPVPSLGQGAALCFRRALTHSPGYMDQRLVKSSTLPTFTRGWIFQERLLPSRILHFGPQELSWECLQAATCQCTLPTAANSGGGSADVYTASAQRILESKAIFNHGHWQKLEEARLIRIWHMLVEEYTKLDLTFESDIFPAISGIAKLFQHSSKCEYVAGMWTDYLLYDLAWHKETMSDDSTKGIEWHQRPQVWRAPTWSWAAALGPVKFLDMGTGLSALCKVEEVKCFPYQTDPTGELSGGYLLLRGHLVPTSIKYKPPMSQEMRKHFGLLELDMMQGQVGNIWVDYDSSLLGTDHVPAGTVAQCFMLASRLDAGSLILLLLKESGYDTTNCCTVWQRLGLVQLSRPPNVICDAKEYWFNVFKGRVSDMILVKII